MSSVFDHSSLVRFLSKTDAGLHQQLVSLRHKVEQWLVYIPHTFPHYTSHTVHHSDAIVHRMSQLLFRDEDGDPILKLSPMEVYIVCAAAYLHDIGMVVSDKAKELILSSEEWGEWTTSGGGAKRWREIDAFRKSSTEPSSQRDFAADTQVRFLIAEFVRRTHHLRARDVIRENPILLGDAASDPVIVRAIADVCIAHGLSHYELDDPDVYPYRRDIGMHRVNVRFLAILLRLGDLLDMTIDRACPLLMNAACPLPAESYAHWSQYFCISHMLVATDRIEITAVCNNQEEHRLLADWCSWIIDEIQRAQVGMSHSSRHGEWVLPYVSMNGKNPTIVIKRSPTATYIPSQWRIEMDTETVLNHLISDVYDSPLACIRELLQNSLDATRCELYRQLNASGEPRPEYPTFLPEAMREAHPIRIVLREVLVRNELSDEDELRQVLTFEDYGVGMDREIIQKYLLQVGRSFYTTPSFQREYGFKTNSQFGVGFLSVFRVSEVIEIETFKPSSAADDGPLYLRLTGPRSYLLLEKGRLARSGTKISLYLRESIKKGLLTSTVIDSCRRLELPVIVTEYGETTTVRAEQSTDFIYEDEEDVFNEGASFQLKAFPIERKGIEGDLYVFVHRSSTGESWASREWAEKQYPELSPKATIPATVKSIFCVNGVKINSFSPVRGDLIGRLDFRDGTLSTTISRDLHLNRRFVSADPMLDPRVVSRWTELLDDHIQSFAKLNLVVRWQYLQSLVEKYPIPTYWETKGGMIPVQRGQRTDLFSLNEVLQFLEIAICHPRGHQSGIYKDPVVSDEIIESLRKLDFNFLTVQDWRRLSNTHRNKTLSGKRPSRFEIHKGGFVTIFWTNKTPSDIERKGEDYVQENVLYFLDFGGLSEIGIRCFTAPYRSLWVLNTSHPLIKWVLSLSTVKQNDATGVHPSKIRQLLEAIKKAIDFPSVHDVTLDKLLSQWSDLAVDDELKPPFRSVSRDNLGFHCELE